MRPRLKTLIYLLCLWLGAAASQTPIDGELPNVPEEFLDRTRRLGGDTLRICIYPRSMTAAFDAAVARAVGELLLVNIELVEATSFISVDGLDFVPISEEDLYVYLTNRCEAFMGVTLAPGLFDDWLTVTRPYVATRSVAVTLTDGIADLGRLAPGTAVGTVLLSEADAHLGIYLRSLPESQRWRKLPYPHAPLLVERLLDGSVDVAVGWEPSLQYAAGLHDAELLELSTATLPLPGRLIGMVLRSDNVFVRGALDAAIARLVESGALEGIFLETGFPGTTP